MGGGRRGRRRRQGEEEDKEEEEAVPAAMGRGDRTAAEASRRNGRFRREAAYLVLASAFPFLFFFPSSFHPAAYRRFYDEASRVADVEEEAGDEPPLDERRVARRGPFDGDSLGKREVEAARPRPALPQPRNRGLSSYLVFSFFFRCIIMIATLLINHYFFICNYAI